MAQENVLLVEGNDDLHVLSSLFQHYQIPETFELPDPERGGGGGIDNLLLRMEGYLGAASNLKRLGVVVDADTDIESRWRKIRNILTKMGYQNLPDAPDPAGTVIEEELKPTFGAWIMPDNRLPGSLENFVSHLVPEGDILWPHAISTVDALPERRFSELHTAKVHIHTYLAWQEKPGRPMG